MTQRIVHENSEAFGTVVSRARRFQREQLEATIAAAGARGMRAWEVAHVLSWPVASTCEWITEAMEAGELVVAPDTISIDPRYVTAANVAAIAQADGGGQ